MLIEITSSRAPSQLVSSGCKVQVEVMQVSITKINGCVLLAVRGDGRDLWYQGLQEGEEITVEGRLVGGSK